MTQNTFPGSVRHLLPLLVVILHISHSESAPVNSILDLTATNSSAFQAQAALWTASASKTTQLYTQCNNTYILGGYGVLGSYVIAGFLIGITPIGAYYQRIYSNLSTHTIIRFTATIWALDEWTTTSSNSDRFQLQFDGVLIDGVNYVTSSFPSNLCGSSGYNDLAPIRVFGRVAHSQSSLTLKVLHMINKDSTLASVAVRDVSLLFVNNSTESQTTSLCVLSSVDMPAYGCTCPEGQYLNSVGTCVSCDSSCSSCFGASARECYQCTGGYISNGTQCILCDASCSQCYGTLNTQCTVCKPGYWLFSNTTCVSSCNTPLIQTSDDQQSYCESPCNATQYVLWDDSCGSSCQSPLIVGVLLNITSSCNYPCGTNQSLYWNGTCSATCTAPLVQVTYSNHSFCNYPCDQDQSLYWNGTCSATCTAPLAQVTYSNRSFCNYPCATNQFLYWNGTCSAACTAPLVQVTYSNRSFCNYPCATNQSLYWNGTCSAACTAPLAQVTYSNRSFCNYPCATNQSLYWNETCSATCTAPLAQVTYSNCSFCNYPCQQDQFLYWNGSCLPQCSFPYVTTVLDSYSYCYKPCASASQVVYMNATCADSCVSGFANYSVDNITVCRPICVSSQYLYANGSCLSACSYPYSQLNADNITYCTLLSNNGTSQSNNNQTNAQSNTSTNTQTVAAATISAETIWKLPFGLYKHLQYIRYLHVDLPSNLNFTAQHSPGIILSYIFTQTMPDELQSKFSVGQAPSIYEQRGVHEKFLVNIWDVLQILAIMSAIGLLSGLLEIIVKKRPQSDFCLFFGRLRTLILWNLTVLVITTNIGEITLYAILELSAASSQNGSTICSFIACICIMSLSFGFLAKIFLVVKKPAKPKISPTKSELKDSPSKAHSPFSVVINGFKRTNWVNKHFLLVYTLRSSLSLPLTYILSQSPLIQSTTNLTIGSVILLHILTNSPIHNRVNLIQLIVTETATLAGNVCMIILTSASTAHNYNQRLVDYSGTAVFVINIFINVFWMMMLFVKTSLRAVGIYKAQKRSDEKMKSKMAYFDLVVPILQQVGFGFGFEEMLDAKERNFQREESVTDDLKEKVNKLGALKLMSMNLLQRGAATIDDENTPRNYASYFLDPETPSPKLPTINLECKSPTSEIDFKMGEGDNTALGESFPESSPRYLASPMNALNTPRNQRLSRFRPERSEPKTFSDGISPFNLDIPSSRSQYDDEPHDQLRRNLKLRESPQPSISHINVVEQVYSNIRSRIKSKDANISEENINASPRSLWKSIASIYHLNHKERTPTSKDSISLSIPSLVMESIIRNSNLLTPECLPKDMGSQINDTVVKPDYQRRRSAFFNRASDGKKMSTSQELKVPTMPAEQRRRYSGFLNVESAGRLAAGEEPTKPTLLSVYGRRSSGLLNVSSTRTASPRLDVSRSENSSDNV